MVEVAHQLVDHHLRCSQGGPGKNEELGGPGGEPMGRCRLAVGRLDHGVEVGAAEPKPRHPRRAVFVQPRGGAAVQPERAGGGVPVVVGGGDVVGRWSHPRGHGACHSDEPRQAGCALGVTDLGFHRAEHGGPHLGPGAPEQFGQGGQLGAVAHHRAGAVCLHQPNIGRVDAALGVGPLQTAHLTVLAGSGQAQVAPVRRCGHRLDHGVDRVAVAPGVLEAFQHDAGDALAEGDAVGVGGEGAALAGGGQGVHAGEQQVVVDAVV